MQDTGRLARFIQAAAFAALVSMPAAAGITLFPNPIAFGSVHTNAGQVGRNIEIGVVGSTTSITSISITGPDASEFTRNFWCDPPDANNMPPGSLCSFDIFFDPSTTGARSATLEVGFNDGSAGTATVGITALGVIAGGSLAPPALVFASTTVGQTTAIQTFTLTADSGPVAGDLGVSSVTAGGTNPGDFVVSEDCTAMSIAPGGNCTISVSFSPTATGARSATITVASNADTPIPAANVSGTGVAPAPEISVSPTNVVFGAQPLGQPTATQTVTVANQGLGNLLVSIVSNAPSEFQLTSSNCSTVAPSQSCIAQVAFVPLAIGARSSSLTITSDDLDEPTTNVSLSGTGVAIDTTPNVFAFTDVTGVARNSTQTSNAVTIGGINVPANISVSGGEYSIGCTLAFVTGDSTIANTQSVCVRHVASSVNGQATHTTLTVGGVSDTFSSTTIPAFTLMAAASGTGSGTITGTGIGCPGDCSESVDAGTQITLTATPNAGSVFAGWSGAGCSGTGTCTATLDADKTATATFTINQYTLTTTFGGTGFGTMTAPGISCPGDCSELVNHGTVVTVTATPSAGSVFVGWGNCDSVTANQCTVTMTASRPVTASFALLLTYNVVLEGWQQAGPYVITAASGGGTATYDNIAHTLTLNLTYSGLSSAETMAHIHGPAARGANAPVLITLDAGSPKTQTVPLTTQQEAQLLNGELYVNIHTSTYPNGEIRGQIDVAGATVLRTLTVDKTGSGTVTGTTEAGTVVNCGSDCDENVPNGKVVALTATAGAGSAFTGWSGACTGTGECNVTMDAAKTVTATFAQNTYVLTVTKLGAGTGFVASTSPLAAIECGATCSASFAHGTSVTLIGSAAVGSTFGTWGGACSSVGSCVVTMDAAKTVTATFNLASPPNPPNPPRLVNISTRMQVLTGDNVMIGGLIVGGPVNKTVVLRARGPSMVPLGVTNPLVNPKLDLYSGQTIIATSDDWGGNVDAPAITASGFAPPEPAEAAILINLAPGPYTAIVSGVGNTTGVGLVEVFEVDHPEVPLINIATRGRVQTGLEVMIAGFIIQGAGQQTVVVRARGPSLTQHGVPDVLANPTLALVRSSDGVVIAANDDWGTAVNAAQLLASGFAPADPLEAAILITLDPGAYTAIVRGAGETSGVAIVEVFRN